MGKIKDIFGKPVAWMKASNRWKHLLCGMAIGLVFGFWAAVAAGGACEFKDRAWGGTWDWTDFGITALGGLAGWAVRAFAMVHLMGLSLWYS